MWRPGQTGKYKLDNIVGGSAFAQSVYESGYDGERQHDHNQPEDCGQQPADEPGEDRESQHQDDQDQQEIHSTTAGGASADPARRRPRFAVRQNSSIGAIGTRPTNSMPASYGCVAMTFLPDFLVI